MLLHCPLASDENVYKLLRFRSFPIAIGNEVFAHVHAPKPLIAIGARDRSGHEKFVELDDVELNHCDKINNLYVCPHHQIISKAQPSCLYNLYRDQEPEALRDCQLKLATQADDTIMAIGKNLFLSYAKEAISYDIYCRANDTRLKDFVLGAGYQEFEVRDGCVADLPQFIAQPVNDLYSSFERTQFALSRKWQLDSLDDILKDLKTDSLEDTLKRLDELPTVKKYGNFPNGI